MRPDRPRLRRSGASRLELPPSLADPDEYRTILRHLLHLSGQITYTPDTITVTLDRPDSPRVARALTLLTEELNTNKATMPGDPRPLTYQISAP